MIVSLPSPRRAEQIRGVGVGVAFEVLNAVRLGSCFLADLHYARASRPRDVPHLHSNPLKGLRSSTREGNP